MENLNLNRITINPEICNGKPTIRGIRISVETILQYLSAGDSEKDILEAYPFLEKEDIQACIAFALKSLTSHKESILLAS